MHTHAHTHTHIHIYQYMHAYACTHTHMIHVHALKRSGEKNEFHVHTEVLCVYACYVCICMTPSVHQITYVSTNSHVYLFSALQRTNLYIHAYAHTCMYIYIHAYIHT